VASTKISATASVIVNRSVGDTIEHIVDAGYDGVDIWLAKPMSISMISVHKNSPNSDRSTQKTLYKVKRFVDIVAEAKRIEPPLP
jgi:hypothetical protein